MDLIVTPKASLFNPNLVKPYRYNDKSSPKYTATLSFPSEVALTRLEEAAQSALAASFTDTTGAVWPFVEEGMFTRLNTSNRNRPFIAVHGVDLKSKSPEEIDKYVEMFQEESVVKAAISFYTYNYKGNKGVAAKLHEICLYDKDKPITSVRISTLNWGD